MNLKITKAEFQKLMSALRYAAEWKDGLADAYPDPSEERSKYSKEARSFIALRNKLTGTKYVDPIIELTEGMQMLALREIQELTVNSKKGDDDALAE